MSFLDRFKKTPRGPKFINRIWINQAAKEKACIKTANENADLIFIAWSKITLKTFQDLFRKQNTLNEVILARTVFPSRMEGRNYVFLEHHFDIEKEIELVESLNASEVLVYVSLKDPIFSAFNVDRIEKVIQNMGHEEDESIEHNLISKSIERAQKKIKNVGFPTDCVESAKEWMKSLR